MNPPGGEPTDASLVARCRAGEAAAWSEIVRRYQRLVYAVGRRAGLDEHASADVFQTVFTRLVQYLDRIDDPSRLKAWIVTTAKREVLLGLRRSKRTVSLAPPDSDDGEAERDIADEAPLPEAMLEDLQQIDLVRSALDRIDDRCRSLLALLFPDDDERVAYEEVARTLGIPVGSIGPTRARCLEKLRRQLP